MIRSKNWSKTVCLLVAEREKIYLREKIPADIDEVNFTFIANIQKCFML